MGVASMAFNTVKDIATGLGAAALAAVMVAGTPANDAQAGEKSAQEYNSIEEIDARYQELCGPGITNTWLKEHWKIMTVGEYVDILRNHRAKGSPDTRPETCFLSFHFRQLARKVQEPQFSGIREAIETCEQDFIRAQEGTGIDGFMRRAIPTYIFDMPVQNAATDAVVRYCLKGERLPESVSFKLGN